MKNYNTKGELIKEANKARLANKNNWVVFQAQYKGYILLFKLYNTWVQRLEIYTKVNNFDSHKLYLVLDSPMELNVKGFNNWIDEQILTLNS